MDIAKIDAEKWRETDGIPLLFSQQTLHSSSLKNPIICIANYLFDSLKQDAFSITPSNQIEQWLITIKREIQDESDHSESSSSFLEQLLSNSKLLTWSKSLIDLNSKNSKFYIVDEEFNQLLAEYSKVINQNDHDGSGASLLIPVGALRLLNRLIRFSNDRLLLIAGDKADISTREFPDYLSPPDITSHDGSLSLFII